ncbi:hypothetical protein BDF14DRAFT_1868223 [Spinellus fusiger]|nr:hypothetical protein BDF14DRAFT_1868223 [Spinellus fusiger]
MVNSVLISLFALISIACAADPYTLRFTRPGPNDVVVGGRSNLVSWEKIGGGSFPENTLGQVYIYGFDTFTKTNRLVEIASIDLSRGQASVRFPRYYGPDNYHLEMHTSDNGRNSQKIGESVPFHVNRP